MPSEPRIAVALEALSAPMQAFRSSIEATIAEVRGRLAAESNGNGDGVEGIEAEFGPFGAERLDARRLSSLFVDRSPLDALAAGALQKALDALVQIDSRGDGIFLVDVTAGESLRDVVAGALEEVGRAFAAALLVERSRARRIDEPEATGPIGAFPFRRWTRAERRLAPPLIVHVEGSDLYAGGLAEFLDGAQKLVVVVRGESPPAPLVRLITPGTFVLQTVDGSGLDRLAGWHGPGVAALVPEGAACFVHDPDAGPDPWERLAVSSMPSGMPARALGGQSVAQLAEEIEQLKILASRPVRAKASGSVEAPAAGSSPLTPAPADPVDKLAAWLLSQAELDSRG